VLVSDSREAEPQGQNGSGASCSFTTYLLSLPCLSKIGATARCVQQSESVPEPGTCYCGHPEELPPATMHGSSQSESLARKSPSGGRTASGGERRSAGITHDQRRSILIRFVGRLTLGAVLAFLTAESQESQAGDGIPLKFSAEDLEDDSGRACDMQQYLCGLL